MYAFLVVYWLIFWQKFLRNPYLLCTSEVMTTNFPHWLWMGRKWRAKDDIYYKYPASIPFMSMWYWPNVVVSKIASKLSLDGAFKLYTYFILAHYLLASFIAYKVFGLFGAITLTYAGYSIKPQTPSFVYTMCWMPGALLGGWFGAFCFGMAILGGYWPILVYFVPVALWELGWGFSAVGVLLGLPQIIPFLKYWPKSVRSGQETDRQLGRLPVSKFLDLIKPTNSVSVINGIHYPEVAMYMGIAPLFIWHLSWWWVATSICILVLCGAIPSIQRIPSRALYLLTLCVCFLGYPNPMDSPQTCLSILILQAYLLLRNASIYPSFPFSQWWSNPSQLYPKGDYTGYLENKSINVYRGGFCLKEVA